MDADGLANSISATVEALTGEGVLSDSPTELNRISEAPAPPQTLSEREALAYADRLRFLPAPSRSTQALLVLATALRNARQDARIARDERNRMLALLAATYDWMLPRGLAETPQGRSIGIAIGRLQPGQRATAPRKYDQT